MKLDLAVARRWRLAERPNPAWAERYGDSFNFAMSFLRRSERHRLWARTIAVIAAIGVASMVSVTSFVALILAGGLSYVNPADEWTNFGVNPQSELKRDIGTNTPLTIPGGRTIGTGMLENALARGKLDGASFLTIDAWKPEHRVYIPRSIYIPYAGDFGTLEDEIQQRLKDELATLTSGSLEMPLVFFCYGAKCWESYNAALRAIKLGYTKVYWYRGGISSWEAAH